MKKYLLLIISMVCAVTGAWAAVTVSGKGTGTITINSETAGDISSGLTEFYSDNKIIVTGKVNADDLSAVISHIEDATSWQDKTLDFSGLTEYPNAGSWPKMWKASQNFNYYILPSGFGEVTEEMVKYVNDQNESNGIFNIYGDLKYIIVPASASNQPAYLYVYNRKGSQGIISDLESNDKSYFTGTESKIYVIGLNGADGNANWSTLFNTLKANETWGSKIAAPSYVVSGGTVTINRDDAAGIAMTTLLSEAKAKVVSGGQSSICTLIVKGELSATDLASLGDNSMTGATRIDLSGATLATGASTDNIQIPSSLTSLILPKNTTVSSVLAGKLEAAGNVNYAYSPSTDPDEADPTVADYVWVNKAGGMAAALVTETSLRGSKYIKVASNVALNASDVDFSSTTTVKYLDLRFANMTQEVSLSYVHAGAPQETGYRLILPDNRTLDEMTEFASDLEFASGAWNMAAIYSYSGTELNIYELNDGKYMTTALANTRIVYPGTTAINVINNTMGAKLLAALNGAASSVKSITIAGSAIDELTFTNPNITSLTLSNFDRSTADVIIADADGYSSLTTLDLTGAKLDNVTASGRTALTMVRMNGTIINGNADLSGCSNLTTAGFLTNSSTEFKGTLNLASTGLTSFASPAKVTGDINLNHTPLTSLDLTTTQFQNTYSQIHIHATDDESNTNPIATLNSDGNKTISVTNNFNGVNNASPRIHPFIDIADNISEAAASGDATVTGCNDCKITYDAAKGVATVHAVHEGHFADLMKALYASYPQGTTFRFDESCHLNLDDLKALCGKNTDNDMNWRSNYYYVDLYDVPATEALCKSATFVNNQKTAEGGVIYQWIEWMRENDRQVKGLILPKDHTQYGSGTTLIQDGAGTNTQLATCSEFIAYYKTKDEQGNSLTQQTFVGHVYNQSTTAADAYQASYEKMLSLVDAHTYTSGENEVPEVKTNADIVLISSNSATKLNSSSTSISGSTRIETINNEMVGTQTGKASIYAYPIAPGAFATASASTGLKSTPTELLQINGTLTNDDIDAINGFTDGPRVLDLRYATSAGQTGMITKAMLEALTNTHIEYILLPEGQTKAVVCGSDYSDLTSLKAVISSTSTNLVAYIDEAGSLAEARYLATGGSVTPGTPNIYSPAKVGLTSVTLAGNLNAADIGCNLTTYHTDANGHWKNTSGDQASVGLSMETGITSIDLADAVFVNKATDKTTDPVTYADMNLSWAGLANLSDIKLPTSTEMKDIPESCCEGLASLKEICIPHNYENIHNAAFLNTIVVHITTTDAKGTLVDNGPNTYTLSANLKQVGDEPEDNTVGLTATQTVFPQNRPVFDCYVLATRTPICYKNAFPANMLYGWGGFDGTLPYCRDKYVNGTNYYCVLRFPSQESWDATVADKRDTSYDLMKQQYTDVTKVYSKKEQTGAVDANGDAITWPTFSELRRAYNQATAGITWNNWVANYDGQQEVNGGENIPTEATGLTLGHYKSTDGTANNDLGDYPFENYEGWHQFTLSQATYVEPDEVNPETREYEDAGWFTFCIPYDMTMKQVREWLGVPKSEGNVHCYYNNTEVTTTPMMPDIRMLASVIRHTSTGAGNNNKVTFRLSTNLYSDGAGHFLSFNRSATTGSRWTTADAADENSYPDTDSKPVLRGGIPYIIKAYKRKGEKIKSYNLGQYIMTRYGDQFKLTQACLNHGTQYYEYLGTETTPMSQKATLKFSKPYEEAVVVAAVDTEQGGKCTYMDGDTNRDYEYALVGTFWNQKLPQYCFYQSKGTWYRNTNDNGYQWSAYKCVIMAVPVKEHVSYTGYADHNGQYYRENPTEIDVVETGKSFYPTVEAGTTDKLNGTLKIVFADGRDDDDFQSSAPGYVFEFDDTVASMEYVNEDGSTTVIDRLDGGELTPLSSKIYNMSGQYMGTSTDTLPKGMYIMNGKKFVVK